MFHAIFIAEAMIEAKILLVKSGLLSEVKHHLQASTLTNSNWLIKPLAVCAPNKISTSSADLSHESLASNEKHQCLSCTTKVAQSSNLELG